MKIIECYIENFGRLHQFSFKFNDRLNTINELNGWGKTTFSTFIRAMFYGMEATRTKKNLEDDERRKYKPWQGGNFGGYIIFELNDKVYKVERFFADKSKDDTFVLYNQNTGLESKDFSANIGEEIFKLDKAAYSRSTYIPQNEINIAANDSINAKLSNLIENNNANDINNYDLAMKLLEKSKKEYVKTGSRGKLDIIKNKITATESDLKICLAKAEATDEWNERLGKILGQKKEIKEKLQNVKNQVDNASKYETRTAKLQQYTELCDTEKKLQADFEPFDTFFKGDLPTEDRLNKCDEISSELLKVKGELKSYELTDYEKTENQKWKEVFSKGVPSEKTINDCEAFISKYRENEIKIEANKLTVTENLKKAELDKFFAKGVPAESEIDKFIDVIPKLNEIKSKITTENSKLEILKNVQLQNTQQNNKKPINILLPIGIVVAMLGIALLFLYFPAGIGCIIAGGILFELSFVRAKKQPATVGNGQDSNMVIQKFVDDLTMQKQSIEAELNNFLGQFKIEINPDNYYASLTVVKTKIGEHRNIAAKLANQEIIRIKNEQSDFINRINSWLETYGDVTSLSFGQKEDLWNNVKRSRTEYLRIEDKLAKYKQISENGENLKNELFELTKNYFNELDENPSKNVNLLKEKRKEYSRLFKELADLKARKEQFKNENDIEILKNMAVPEHNLGELQSHEKALENDLDGITVEENNAREQIRNLSEDADRCSELGSEIDQLYEELKIGEERLEILNKTVQCLGNAKENFSTRYMDKMYQGFEHYIKMLDNGTLGETHMDLELNVNVSAYGSQKSLDYFSTGYKDLIGIATRFALIDALFENEKPFIILDDPFTNLDGEKLNKALSMIQEISRKYQIIYFVCHESRVTCN